MTPVRAGTIPAWKYFAYTAAVALEIAAMCAAVVAGSGFDRVVTGLLLGLTLGLPFGWLLRRMDSVVLTEEAILHHRFLRTKRIAWERVIGGRFAYDERSRWTLALDLTPGDERHHEVVLLSIAPVIRPVSNAYELHKREQVDEIREILRYQHIPVTVLPEILQALQTHWGITAPSAPAEAGEEDTL